MQDKAHDDCDEVQLPKLDPLFGNVLAFHSGHNGTWINHGQQFKMVQIFVSLEVLPKVESTLPFMPPEQRKIAVGVKMQLSPN